MIAADKAFRDHVALTVMSSCMADLSRQISDGKMPKMDVDTAIDFITMLAYTTADSMLRARKVK